MTQIIEEKFIQIHTGWKCDFCGEVIGDIDNFIRLISVQDGYKINGYGTANNYSFCSPNCVRKFYEGQDFIQPMIDRNKK
ncbi:MAG TPA: hypothetical protein DGG95_00940 [Cytophagales bacterium]|jgi:hypothetical protein|nr:hypothetical protein [Cytophagales bacterium]